MSGLSYSNFSVLRQCGQKYRLKVIEKIPEGGPNVAMEFGTAMHAALNNALEDKDPETAMMVFSMLWEKVAPTLDFKGQRHDANAHLEMGVRFIGNFTRKYATKMRLITGEKRLYAPVTETISVEGTPDALVEWNGEYVLLDFKTSAYNYEAEKSACSLQLNLYAHLLEASGLTVNKLCYFVFSKATGSTQTPLLVEYDRKKAVPMIMDMLAYAERNAGYHEKNPNACVMGKNVCGYFSRCYGGKDE